MTPKKDGEVNIELKAINSSENLIINIKVQSKLENINFSINEVKLPMDKGKGEVYTITFNSEIVDLRLKTETPENFSVVIDNTKKTVIFTPIKLTFGAANSKVDETVTVLVSNKLYPLDLSKTSLDLVIQYGKTKTETFTYNNNVINLSVKNHNEDVVTFTLDESKGEISFTALKKGESIIDITGSNSVENQGQVKIKVTKERFDINLSKYHQWI